MLFRIEKALLEMADLAEMPEYAEKVRTLFQDLIVLQRKMGDKLELEELLQGR